MPSNRKLMNKIRDLVGWIALAQIVEFVEAYCAPRDTFRRSPKNRRSRESTRRSPESRYCTNTRARHHTSRRDHRFEPEQFEQRDFDLEFDLQSARRRADYESARRTDFDLSAPGGSKRSPDSAPEGSPGTPPEPAPSAPPLHELHSRHYNRSYFRSESSSEAPSSSASEDEEELDAYDASGAVPSLHSPDSGRSYPAQPRRNPSPYYYGDLFRTVPAQPPPPAPALQPTVPRYRKSASLDAPHVAARPTLPKRFSVAEDGFRELERSSSSSSGSRAAGWMPPRRRAQDAPGCDCTPPDHVDEPHSSRSVFYVPAPLPRWPREMTAHRVYETAFDSKIARSDDDLDDFDRVSNHQALLHIGERSVASSSSSAFEAVERGDPDRRGRRKVTMKTDSVRRSKIPTIRQKRENENNALALSEEFEKVHLENEDRTASTSQLPLCGFTPTPPATAPLPTKFQQCKDYMAMNSIKSAPNLPAQPAHPRLKDLRLPVKSLRARETPTSSDASTADVAHMPSSSVEADPNVHRLCDSDRDDDDRTQSKDGIFLEIKGRPTLDSDTPESNRHRGPEGVGPILEFKGRPPVARPNHKYSSSESMATSSSGGSMESIGSSTSEDRSTTSSDGRRRASSSTLSSHSSDSGVGKHKPPYHHTAKLHILSPISDKSSLEPASETSDNRNNNSQKVSPEETDAGSLHATEPITIAKPKRRVVQNRNILSLAFKQGEAEMQGSDSGISIHSREGSDSRNTFTKTNDNDNNGSQDLSDLPFDMPKLRRRRAMPSETEDLRSLPFDMPKLRRKLRGQSLQLPDFGGISQASSSQSMTEENQGKPREKLTLDFKKPIVTIGGCGGASRGLNLNLGVKAPPPRDLVDANVPLDRQGWYHGTISRVEAENALRSAKEGAFLVRNSDSAKHDYSLSLKSVRGFMHLRICRSHEGFSLGGATGTTFPTVPELLRHYVAAQRLPVRGAEHMALATPLAAVLL